MLALTVICFFLNKQQAVLHLAAFSLHSYSLRCGKITCQLELIKTEHQSVQISFIFQTF